MIFDTVLSWLGLDKLKNAVVVGKHPYPAATADIPSASVGAGVSETTSVPERWSLEIRGQGAFGGIVREEVFVDELTFNNTQEGDKWPAT